MLGILDLSRREIVQLICNFGFAYGDCWFSGAEAHIYKPPHEKANNLHYVKTKM